MIKREAVWKIETGKGRTKEKTADMFRFYGINNICWLLYFILTFCILLCYNAKALGPSTHQRNGLTLISIKSIKMHSVYQWSSQLYLSQYN